MGSAQSASEEAHNADTALSETSQCDGGTRGAEASEASYSSSFASPLFSKKTAKEVEKLIGKLQHLPRSAQKLFSLTEVYLAKNSCGHIQSSDSSLQRLARTGEGNISDETEIRLHTDTDQKSRHELGASLFVPLNNSPKDLSPPQTFLIWKNVYTVHNVYPYVCIRKPNVIYLQPIDCFPNFVEEYQLQKGNLTLSFFSVLQGFAQIFFSGLEVLVRHPIDILPTDNIQSRTHETTEQKQLCVNDIYPKLRSLLPPDGIAIVGLSWTDIYPKGFNFTLGEASISHHAAVLSFGRFETKGFNAETHKDVDEVNGELLWKLLKTLTHETCHLLGLEHCQFFSCAMNESGSVTEAMHQPMFLCPICLRKLQQACQFNVLERYEQMRSFLQAVNTKHGDSPCLTDALAWLDGCISYLTYDD